MIQLFPNNPCHLLFCSASPKLELFPVFPFVWWKNTSRTLPDDEWRHMTSSVTGRRDHRVTVVCPCPQNFYEERTEVNDRDQPRSDPVGGGSKTLLRLHHHESLPSWRGLKSRPWYPSWCIGWLIEVDACPGRRVRVSPARGAGCQPSRRVYAEQWGPPMRSNRGVLRTWVWRGKWRNEMDWWTVEFGDNVDT